MNRNTLSITAVTVLALSVMACAAPEDHELDESRELTGTTAQAQSANGFFCGPSSCHCNIDSDNPVDSCDGMIRVCDLIGPGMLCAPDGWCSCIITKTAIATAAASEPTTKPRPTKIVTFGAATKAAIKR